MVGVSFLSMPASVINQCLQAAFRCRFAAVAAAASMTFPVWSQTHASPGSSSLGSINYWSIAISFSNNMKGKWEEVVPARGLTADPMDSQPLLTGLPSSGISKITEEMPCLLLGNAWLLPTTWFEPSHLGFYFLPYYFLLFLFILNSVTWKLNFLLRAWNGDQSKFLTFTVMTLSLFSKKLPNCHFTVVVLFILRLLFGVYVDLSLCSLHLFVFIFSNWMLKCQCH